MEVVTRDDTLVFLGGREFFSCITAITVCETHVSAKKKKNTTREDENKV